MAVLRKLTGFTAALYAGKGAFAEEIPPVGSAPGEIPVDDGTRPAAKTETDAKTNVIQLTKDNFSDVITENKFVLLKWYAPWCGHCKSMAADYGEAADRIKGGEINDSLEDKSHKVVLAEVDATTDNELASQYDVQGYPTVQWFVNGLKKVDYSGPRSADAIVAFVKESVGPALKQVTAEELETLKKERKWGNALVSFTGAEGDLSKLAAAVAELPIIASQVVFTKSDTAALTINRGTKEVATFSGDMKDEEAVKAWISEERRPKFGQISEDNFELYMEHAKEGLFWVCIDPKNINSDLEKYSDALVTAADGKNFPFVWLDVSEFEEHAKQELGCTSYPTIVLQRGDLLGERGDAKVDKFVRSFSEKPDELNAGAIAEFFSDVESGKLEAVPEPDELDGMDEAEDGEDAEEDAKDADADL